MLFPHARDGHVLCELERVAEAARVALGYRTSEQAVVPSIRVRRGWDCLELGEGGEERADGGGACGLSEERDAGGVAAEGGEVGVEPVECCDLARIVL